MLITIKRKKENHNMTKKLTAILLTIAITLAMLPALVMSDIVGFSDNSPTIYTESNVLGGRRDIEMPFDADEALFIILHVIGQSTMNGTGFLGL